MKSYDKIFGFIWLALGSAIAIEALRLGIGRLHFPGVGLLAFIIGVSLGLCGLFLMISAALQGEEGDKLWSGQNWKKVILLSVALFAYTIFMELLGFLLATFLLVFILFKMTAPKRWFSPLVSSAAVVFSCYLVFFVWLKILLPKGIFGIG